MDAQRPQRRRLIQIWTYRTWLHRERDQWQQMAERTPADLIARGFANAYEDAVLDLTLGITDPHDPTQHGGPTS